MLAYIAPSDGMLSIWVRTVGAADDRVIARDPARPILQHVWRGDSRHVLYLQDAAGNENFHLFQVAASGGDARELTPGERVRAGLVAVDHRFPNDVLITSNERDETVFDVHRLDLETGTARLEVQNPGDVSSWLNDNAFVVRAAAVHKADGSSLIRVRDRDGAPWRTLDEFGVDDGTPQLVAFSADDASLYVVTAKEANAARLVRYDLAGGPAAVLAGDPDFDVESVYVDPSTNAPLAVAILRDRIEWQALDAQFEPDIAALRALHHGDVAIDDASADGTTLILRYTVDDGPVAFYSYDRATRTGSLLFHSRPGLLGEVLAPMRPVVFPARDGLKLHAYLTLPAGIEPRNLPTVMVVHGGPWHRDRWGYDPFAQWLANRGYAVLQVNFRGSTGYGKAYLNAGNREWAGAMRTDLLDARDWAIGEGYADPRRFAIMGGSYGGYAVLTALAFTPDAFSCGVDIVGPSNLNTLLASIPPYWKTMRSMFTQRMGDDPAFLDAQSPLLKAAAIAAPLLIAQGANDPRVKRQESDQIVEVMRAKGVPVTYLLFEDEGHGFAKPENTKRFTALVEGFLGGVLGGRVEPPSPEEDATPFLR